jgi:predicted MFS family arabinose efflux permease
MVTLRTSYIRDPTNIALSALAVALLLAFFWWMHCRERANKSTMIPNSLWRNPIFSSICAAVFVSWAVFATGSYFLTLYFQKVQLLSALQTSYRLLPMVAAGAVTNVATGFLVHRVEANILVTATAALSVVGPLMMALANPTWSYWAGAFVTALLLPIGADTLFTISNLVITSVFPARTHGLAGGVFNTVAQIGNSFGLAIGAVVASTVSAGWVNKTSVPALAAGYRGVFWTCLGAQLAVVVVARWGLRGSGKVGLKSE